MDAGPDTRSGKWDAGSLRGGGARAGGGGSGGAGVAGGQFRRFGDGEFQELDPDFVLTNVMLYWLTGTATSATRFYYEDAKAGSADGADSADSAGPTTVPIGLAMFAGDFDSIRTFAERDHWRIVRWTGYGDGGHYAAHLAPDALSRDIGEFFAALP